MRSHNPLPFYIGDLRLLRLPDDTKISMRMYCHGRTRGTHQVSLGLCKRIERWTMEKNKRRNADIDVRIELICRAGQDASES